MAGETSIRSTRREEGTGAGPVLLSVGDPQIFRTDGPAPVRPCVAAMPGRRES